MNRLQEEGVRGADLVFACIGPALEVYSRYSKVVDAEEREIPLGGNPEAREAHQRGFLAYVWEVVGRAALEEVLGTAESKARNGAAGALEEDARLTALFLWTLQATTQDAEPVSTTDDEDVDAEPDDDDEDEAPSSKKKKKGLSLPFDVARRFAQPLGIHLDAWEGRCIETEKGIVRLIPVLDRAEQLFGEDGAEVVADRLEKHRTGPIQPTLFPMDDEPPPTPIKGRKRKGGGQRLRRIAAQASWSDDARPRPRGHADAIGRAGQCLAGLDHSPRQSAGRTSCGSPTPCRRSTRKAATKSGFSTRCSWRSRGDEGDDGTHSSGNFLAVRASRPTRPVLAPRRGLGWSRRPRGVV